MKEKKQRRQTVGDEGTQKVRKKTSARMNVFWLTNRTQEETEDDVVSSRD